MALIWGDRVLFPRRDMLEEGWIHTDGDRIVAVGRGAAPRKPDFAVVGGSVLTPGFVDVHAHGGGGASFGTDDPAEVETVLAAHRACGTTTMIASLVTADLADLERQLRLLAGFVSTGRLAGVHLEGPWLSPDRCGAHAADLLREPAPENVRQLIDAGQGAVRMITLAPELSGALASIRAAVARGCVVAVGHTNADYDQTKAAIDAGASGATHLFNAMPPLAHREPGPTLALWSDPRVWLELVCDGVHVDLALVAHILSTSANRVVFVTDAMAGAGVGDGDYCLGGLAVEVRGGVARLADGGAIAGSTLTLDLAVRVAVAAGVRLEDALRAVTENPAAYLRLPDVGRFAPGCRADAVVLSEDLDVARVLYGGAWLG